MAGEWPTMTLREANVTLIDCDHRTPPAADTGYPYVAIPQLRAGRIDLSGVRRITREHYLEWTRKAKPSTNDVILSRRCNPGETAVAPPDLEFALGQNLVLLRADGTKVYPPFLRWLVRGPEWWEQVSKFINVGTVFDSLKCADIPDFELRIPPLPEQRAIAHTLGTLDDKFELNRQMSETLEAMARVLFKSWFVNFDSVRDKMEGLQPAGIDAETAALFPDSFEDSPIGKIPKGWRVKLLDNIAEFLNGLALQKHPPKDDHYLPVIKIAELRRGITDSSDRASADIDKKYVVEDSDIIFSWSGSLEVCIWCGGRGALNQHLFKVTSNHYPKWFYYQWIKHYLPEFQRIAATKATTMGHIQRHHLSETLVIVPDADILAKMDQLMTPLLDRIISNGIQSRTLTTVRDVLLPKLIFGDLRVKDAEKFIGRTV